MHLALGKFTLVSQVALNLIYSNFIRIQNHCIAFTFLYRDFSIFPKFAGTLGLGRLFN